MIVILRTAVSSAFSWVKFHWSLFLFDNEPTWMVMVGALQAPSDYLNQCWPWFVMSYDVTGPHWDDFCEFCSTTGSWRRLLHWFKIKRYCHFTFNKVRKQTYYGISIKLKIDILMYFFLKLTSRSTILCWSFFRIWSKFANLIFSGVNSIQTFENLEQE